MALETPSSLQGPDGNARGQAALFDGIFFLLLVSASIAMMFVFLVNYGTGQEQVLRTAHVVNYMNSVFKEMYFLDASLLKDAAMDGRNYNDEIGGKPNPYAGLGRSYNPAPNAPNPGCDGLKRFVGSVSLADLMKKDLADGLFDDQFGTVGTVVSSPAPGESRVQPGAAPGKTALRCAMKEILRPFEAAGFSYFVEVFDASNYPTYPTSRANVPATNGGMIPNDPTITGPEVVQTSLQKSVVTNSPLALSVGSNAPVVRQCEDVTRISSQNLVVAAPFRVIIAAAGGADSKTFVIRLCVWPQTQAERA